MTAAHHGVRQHLGGTWVIARPLRAGWWTQRRAERRCRDAIGHCWHPDGYVDWWCCECSAETDGCPPQRCSICQGAGTHTPGGPTP